MPRNGGKGRVKGGAVCRQKIGPLVNPLHLAALLWENSERHVLPTNFRFLAQPANAANGKNVSQGIVPGRAGKHYEFFQFLRLLMNERPFMCHGEQLHPGSAAVRPLTRPGNEQRPHAQCNDVVFRLMQINSGNAPKNVMYHHHWFWFADPNDRAEDSRNGAGRARFHWPFDTDQAWTIEDYGGLLFRPDRQAVMPEPPDDTSDYWDKIRAAMSVYTRSHNVTAERFVEQAEGIANPAVGDRVRRVLKNVAVAAILYNVLASVHGTGQNSALRVRLPANVANIQRRSLFHYFRRLYAFDSWQETETANALQFVPLPILFTKKVRPGTPWAAVLDDSTDLATEPRDWRAIQFHVHAANVAMGVCGQVPALPANVDTAAGGRLQVPNAQRLQLVECSADGQWILQAVRVKYKLRAQAQHWRSAAQLGNRLRDALNATPTASSVQVAWKKADWKTQRLIVPNGCIGPNAHGFVCRNCGNVWRDVPTDASARHDVPYHERQNSPCLLCSFHGNDKTSDMVDLRARHVVSGQPEGHPNNFRARGRGMAPRANRGLLTTFKNYFVNVPKFLQHDGNAANGVRGRNWNVVRGAFGSAMPWSKIYRLLNVKLRDPEDGHRETGVFAYFASLERFYANELRNLTIEQLSDAGVFAYIAVLELGVLQSAEKQWRSATPAQRRNLQQAYDKLTRRRAQNAGPDGQLQPVQRRPNRRRAALPANRHALRYNLETHDEDIFAGGASAATAASSTSKDVFTVVVKPGCPFCERALQLLDAAKVTVRVHVATSRFPEADDALAKIGLSAPASHRTFPIVFAGQEFVGGFDDLHRRFVRFRPGGGGSSGGSRSAHLSGGDDCEFMLFADGSAASAAAKKMLHGHRTKVFETSSADLKSLLKQTRGSTGLVLRLPWANYPLRLPLAFTCTGEFVGGPAQLRRLYLGGTVNYGYASGHFSDADKREIEYLLHSVLATKYAPWIKRFVAIESTRQTTGPGDLMVILHKMDGEAIMKHLGTDDDSLRNMSVTQLFNPKQSPLRSDVYFNSENWHSPPAHFDNAASYHCYLVVHEMLHALGIAFHMELDAYDSDGNDGSDASIPRANIMTQQTRPESARVASPCKIRRKTLAAVAPKSIATRVVDTGAPQYGEFAGGNDSDDADSADPEPSPQPPSSPVSKEDVRDKLQALSDQERSFSGED